MRSGIQLCYPFEESRLKKWNASVVIVQPKLDGERCRAVFDEDGHVTLYSSECNVITGVPHINRQLESMKLQNVELDGELYIHEKDFEDIHSIVSRKVNQRFDSEAMEYHVFDVINAEPQTARMIQLNNLNYNHTPNIKPVQCNIAHDIESIMICRDRYIDSGYEGIIIRHPFALYERKRSTYVMKFKPKKSDIYMIVGYIEEITIHGHAKGTLGALTLQGDDEARFNVGSGFSAEQRVNYWKIRDSLIGLWCKVEYQHITSKNKVPRFPIFSCIYSDIIGGEKI